MQGSSDAGEMSSIPLVSSTQPAGLHQQVMSPTLRTAFGYGTNESSATPNPLNSGTEGGLGFASDVAAGRGLEGTGQADTAESGGVQSQASTTTVGSKVPRGYMCPCQHRAGAQVYNPPLACQVQVPSAWAGMVKHC